MAELKSETEEISDALKEKVLLSILKNQFRQDVVDGVETTEDNVALDLGKLPDAPNGSSDHPKTPPGSGRTSGPGSQEPTSPAVLPPPEGSRADHDCVEQEPAPTAAAAQKNPTVLGDQSRRMSTDEHNKESGDLESTDPEKQETTECVEEAPPASEKEEVKSDPIKENEDRLAAEESLLSQDQLKERHTKSQQLRAQANNLYKESAFNDAAVRYSEALQICPLNEEKDRSILHANRAAALMAGHQNKEALPDLDRALELDPNYSKALERRARLNKLLENLDDSLKDYERLLELTPKHYAYIATIKELREQIKKRDEELKAKMLDSLKQLGNVFLKPFGLSAENFSMVPNEGGGYSLQMKGQK